MKKYTKEQETYVNSLFNVYCNKIDKDTTNGEIFKLCRNFVDELKDNDIELENIYDCYNKLKEIRVRKG